MGFLALMILFFALMRLGRFHRMRRWPSAYAYGCMPHRHMNFADLHHLRYAPPAPIVQPKESAFEALKRRYVAGEITDYEYESGLDHLLRTPEGRREIQ